MKTFLKVIAGVLVAAISNGCGAMTPRVSTWDSPKGFTKDQVFTAALQSGGQNSLKTSSSDRESGTMSFSKTVGAGEVTLGAQVREAEHVVTVQTTTHYETSDLLALGMATNLNNEVTNNFYVFLFRNLKITDPSAKNIKVEEMH